MFVSVDGKAKKVKEIFAGGADGKAHRVTELFGSVNGVAKLLYTSNKETNGFDQFSWAEIKQLANEGKLLEHFALHDKVSVKMTEPFSYTYSYAEDGTTKQYTRYQNEIVFQINELTATTMRLSAYNATIFGCWGIYNKKPISSWKSTELRDYVDVAWGLMTVYKYLKYIDNVLPTDLREVLSAHRPMIEYTKHSTGQIVINYDEDMKVRPISKTNWEVQRNDNDVPYTYDIVQSDFPLKKSEYLRYYKADDPRPYQPSTGATYMASGSLVYEWYYDSSNTCYRFKRHIPRVAFDWDRSYEYYTSNTVNETLAVNVSPMGDVIPEILIEGTTE